MILRIEKLCGTGIHITLVYSHGHLRITRNNFAFNVRELSFQMVLSCYDEYVL